jgi:hypothetical protein
VSLCDVASDIIVAVEYEPDAVGTWNAQLGHRGLLVLIAKLATKLNITTIFMANQPFESSPDLGPSFAHLRWLRGVDFRRSSGEMLSLRRW